MKKISPSRLFSFSIFIFLFFTPIAHAETRISGGTVFQKGTAWVKAGSPYILDDSISIASDESLYIGPGVTVIASSTPDDPISISADGDFTIAGTAEDPVVLTGLDNMDFSHANISISHADISLPNGISIFYSTTTIASSTIRDASDISDSTKAISAWDSLLDIKDSSITGNDYGIYSYQVSPGPFLSFFAKTAMADNIVDPKQNRISISGSAISANHAYGIYNATLNDIDAVNNWWGDPSGPRTSSSTTGAGDSIYGPVDYVPWLKQNPASSTPATPAVCCSNVLFLPGMEGSRLYVDERNSPGIGFSTSTNELWEPQDNADVEKMFMDNSGKSINPSIYTKDVIDSAYGVGVYKNFIAMMNGVVADGTINAWEPFAYDWRYGVDTIADSPKLLGDFQSLASSSKTGKVTIVAHSDGGLVAKMLAKILTDKGKADLIDKVVMIAVPQLGTPQAVASLLHGDDQDILSGLILNDATARQLGNDSPGAYGLLPAEDYFTSVRSLSSSSPSSKFLQSMVSFSTSSLADFHLTGDSQTVSTYDALKNFLSGIADHRDQPASADTSLPDILHTSMLSDAENIHASIDAFSFASSTPVISLIGVGDATLAGIHYFENISCPVTNVYTSVYRPQPCTDSLEHAASTTLFGDGTVVDISAKLANISAPDKNYYFNLFSDNKGKIIPDSHATLLNTDSGVSFVKQQITEPSVSATSSVSSGPSAQPSLQPLPAYITDTEPTLADFPEDNLVITMHSPVDINVYDAQGRHTGPIPNPDPTSDLGRYETNIPDSRYTSSDTLGKAITVPYGTDYRVVLTGTGNGSFTLDTERDQNTGIVSQTEFTDMPATPLLKAELFLATTTYTSATSSSGKAVTVATTSQLLVMDFDGDGVIDATSTPGGTIDPTAYLRSMERTIKSFHLSAYREKTMCDKIEKIISYITAKKPINVDEKSAAAAQQALADIHNQHWIFKNLDQAKKDQLTAIFQSILDSADI